MRVVSDADERPIGHADELVRVFEAACKPPSAFRVGAEHEKVGVLEDSGAAVPFDGPRSITRVLEGLTASGWTPVREHAGGPVIALAREGATVSLEPGGQLELSAAPHARGKATDDDLARHVAELAAISNPLGIAWLGLGFRPFGTRDDVAWVPKGRYVVMREYLPTRARRPHDMMKRTATVQANLDFEHEADAAAKLRAAFSVTSLVTALWACSPLEDGRDDGMQSVRAAVWLETDPDRCGLLPFVFEDRPIFAAYTAWALDVPMFFVVRGGRYLPGRGLTFRRFLAEGFEGERATLGDWETHLSTLFPEARLRRYLEVRGADAGPLAMVRALPALWKGILYDADARAAATALTSRLSMADREALRAAVPRAGLATPMPDGGTVLERARALVRLARDGLARVAPEELPALAAVEEVAATGRAPSELVREAFARGGPPAVIAATRIV